MEKPNNNNDLTFLQKFAAPIDVLWQNYKVFFIVFGLIILAIKFQNVIFSILKISSDLMINKAKKQDEKLQNEINSLDKEADKLKEEIKNQKPSQVDEDWHLKK